MTEVRARAVRAPPVSARAGNAAIAFLRVLPYALAALGLRLLMAGVFFLSGQAKVAGPRIPIDLEVIDRNLIDLNLRALGEFSIILPAEIKPATFQLFETEYAGLPLPPVAAAYLFTYAEFVLPICLVIGFATRFAALGLLLMTALMQIYVAPGMWWAAHVYWISILLVLVTAGPGAFSIDALIRSIHRGDRAGG
jgi:putative oxidoreductase